MSVSDWSRDGSTGDPVGDMMALRDACMRQRNIPRQPEIIVNGIAGLRDYIRRLAAAFPGTQTFVSVVRQLNPRSLRRKVLRSEIERRRAKR